ncbi:MAG: hypothetical protein NVSMB29_02360 [Candidatus Dormibacteria bacterium]
MVAPLSARRLLQAAGAALALTWLAVGARGPALYDGLPLSVEPYRYLHPPSGAPSTPAPTAAEKQVPVNAGRSQPFELDTAETGPQVQLLADAAAFPVAAGVATVEVRIDPIDPPATPPPGAVDGNVYRLAASAAGKPVELAAGASCSVTLRGTGGNGAPVLAELANGRWALLPTVATGNPGFYSANVTTFGAVALVFPGASSGSAGTAGQPLGGGGTPSGPPGWLAPTAIIAGVALVLVGFAGGVRVQRRRRRGGPRHRRGP